MQLRHDNLGVLFVGGQDDLVSWIERESRVLPLPINYHTYGEWYTDRIITGNLPTGTGIGSGREPFGIVSSP
jgi:hypothetical protein